MNTVQFYGKACFEKWKVGDGYHKVYFMEGDMEKNGSEVAGENARRNKVKDQEETALEAIDEVIDGHLIDLILMVEKDEAQAVLKMERKEVLERIDLVWRKEYLKIGGRDGRRTD